MRTVCPICKFMYDDETCWTICPHGPIAFPLEDYCRKCDTLKSVQGMCLHQKREEEEKASWLDAGYVCRHCGLDVADVKVRPRADDEDVINYMHHVLGICGANHTIRSPYCRTHALDLKLPMSDNGIGRPGRPLTDEEAKELNAGIRKPNNGTAEPESSV